MPNWCENELRITGPPEEMDRFVREAQGTARRYGPMRKDASPPEKQMLCFHKLFPVPTELLKRSYGADMEHERDLPAIDGCTCGADWEIKYWGCKWGVSNENCQMTTAPDDDIEAGYWFLTAWSPATGFFEHMSKMFPKLRFELTYRELGLGFKGQFIVCNGKVEVDVCEDLVDADEP